jgi:FkbM family methyltransferase
MTIDHPDQWFGGRTYAQHGDDMAILNVFKRLGIDRPTYLDVGAYHPFDISNTALLYARGCRGINVEPNPALFPAFLKHRPEDQNVNAGVGLVSGEQLFHLHTETSGRNSFVRGAVSGLGIARETFLPVLALDDIVMRYAGGKWPDLLSIDIEGLEPAVLAQLPQNRPNSPKLVCAEARSGDIDNTAKLREIMTVQGYTFLVWCGWNMLWLRADCRRLYT